jgi:hypothetical protein
MLTVAFFVIMNVIMLSVVMISVIRLRVNVLSAVTLNVIMMNVIKLDVTAPASDITKKSNTAFMKKFGNTKSGFFGSY